MTFKQAKRVGSRPWEHPSDDLIEAKAAIERELAKGRSSTPAGSIAWILSGLAVTIEARQNNAFALAQIAASRP